MRDGHGGDLLFRLNPRTLQHVGRQIRTFRNGYFDAGQRSKSTGLLAFDSSGRRAWTRFPRRPVILVGSRGRLAYAWIRRRRTAYVLDLAMGRTLHTMRTAKRAPFLLSPP